MYSLSYRLLQNIIQYIDIFCNAKKHGGKVSENTKINVLKVKIV